MTMPTWRKMPAHAQRRPLSLRVAPGSLLMLLAFAVLLAFAGTPVLAKLGPGPTPTARSRPAPSQRSGISYYLALGDSVPVWNGARSYPYLIVDHLQRKLPGLSLDDIAVSGESTTSMLQGQQYQQALSFLRAHQGHIALITIDIGGNDVVGCAFSIATSGPDSTCSKQARTTIRRNLTAMLAGLRAAAPGVPVIGMSYYDPVLGDWLAGGALRSLAFSSLRSLVVLNHELISLYGGARNTADVQGAFRSLDFRHRVLSPWGKVPIAVQRACSWLDIQCQQGVEEGFGDDPNDAGAAAIASAFERRIDRLCVRRRSPILGRC